MPLLHPENSRGGGGGSQENRRSMADMFNFDNLFTDEAAAPATSRVNGQLAERDAWRWEPPSSPAAAQSPRSLVPAPCFPPNHSAGFASLSELAQPGAPWGGDNEPPGITDLVASFKAMGAPSTSARQNARRNSFHRTRLSCELLFETWQQAQEDSRALNRRASFCGVTDGGGGGGGKQLLVWTGALPPRCAAAEPAGGFSAKVFLGGLPWDINEDTLVHALRDFQPVRVEWPGAEAAPRGFAYVTLESERRVRALLAASRREGAKWIYRITSRNFRTKDVEVIPWAVADSNWVCAEGGGAWGGDAAAGAPTGSVRLEPTRTVFVGALHGILSASALATIMNDLFGGVVYAGIDTDKSKYPIGSGRVTFNNVRSYVRAVSAAFVEIRTDKFTKKIQVDPYLEDSMCSVCNLHQGPYFCRDPACYRYFCHKCWLWQHPADSPAGEGHQALMRNSKGNVNPPAVGYGNGNGNSSNGAFARLNGATPSPATSGSGGSSDCIRGELPALEWRH